MMVCGITSKHAWILPFTFFLVANGAFGQGLHVNCERPDNDDETAFAEWYRDIKTYDQIVEKIGSWESEYPGLAEVSNLRVFDGDDSSLPAITVYGKTLKRIRIGKDLARGGL